MLFPELAERIGKLLGHKPDEPVTTISVGRAPTPGEIELIEWLLTHGVKDGDQFLPQLNGLTVSGTCSCGCPTINLKVAEGIPRGNANSNILADLLGTVEGNLVGVMLFQAGGYLSCLEAYDLAGVSASFGLPHPSSLHPFEKMDKGVGSP